MERKGRPMSDEKRRTLDIAHILNQTGMFARTDFGGLASQEEGVKAKYRKKGVEISDQAAAITLEIMKEMMEGVRRRQKPMLDEIRRRLASGELVAKRDGLLPGWREKLDKVDGGHGKVLF